ncbi:MAG: AAA family ATPase [Eubacterium sp.]|nr:AAA family ATPase [Eubacterium sp.]
MENKQLETVLEENYLKETLALAEKQLFKARETLEQKQEEILAEKREIRENTEHGVTNLWSSDGFEALVELSQSISPITELAADYDETLRKIHRLEQLLRNPYFARIDFCFEDEEEAENVYIGRTSLSEGNAGNIYVYDWRSPIASVFYRFMTGPAYYEAPAGRIEGQVKCKRQYEIKDRQLLYFFDTDLNINDEILKQLLSRNTSPRMKAIVETIQRDQDEIIRNMESDLLMIQGVAGSGKTSIALHRAAYLMYQGLQSKLSANHILILSPNAAFEQYIADVLPELGEENVVSMVFEDLLHAYLKERKIQPQSRYLEAVVTDDAQADFIKKSMSFKSSEQFRLLMDQFVADMPLSEIRFEDISLDGQCIATKEEMRQWVLDRPQAPLAERLEQLGEYVLENLEASKGHVNGSEKNEVLQKVQNCTKLNVYYLYRKLWEKKALFRDMEKKSESAGDGCDLQGQSAEDAYAGCMRGIRKRTLENMESECMPFEDAAAVLYLHLKIYGSSRFRNIRQVIIDEAQDYTLLQYEIFRMIFPNAKYTVLGDVNQTLTRQKDLSFYEQVQNTLHKKRSSLVTLEKSFRCTNEILQFGLQFIKHRPQIQCFNRQGDEVAVRAFDQHEQYLKGIAMEAEACRSQGFRTVCLLCRTEKKCAFLYEELKSRIDLHRMEHNEIDCLEGVFLLPSYMAKGLEFDAVLICDADAKSFYSENDRKILYMESTRALHRLGVFCEGALTPLIGRQ